MTLRPEYSLGHSEYNDFLFAVVGEEKNGLRLTVLSALARLGVDPWGEAARLSKLPKEAATGALEATIASLPDGAWAASEARSIAVRLVACLPKRGSISTTPPPQGDGIEQQKPKLDIGKWLVWGAFIAAVLIYVLRQYNS